MNHKKAMPANGMRFNPITTVVLRPASVSHVPGAPGWAGTDSLSSTSAVIREHGKDDPGDRGRPGCSQRAPGLKRILANRFPRHEPPPFPRPGAAILSTRSIATVAALFSRQHGLGFAFEVDVGAASDVDGHPLAGAAGKVCG